MKRVLFFAAVLQLAGCGFISGFATPREYFPDRDETCPPNLARPYPSFLEAMRAIEKLGASARRREWLVAAPGELCLLGPNASKPFVMTYNMATGAHGLFIYRKGSIEPWTPSDEDKVANDWEAP
jgi:hypothetical protein